MLKWFFDEIGNRHHQPALVPYLDHDIGEGYLFNPAPFIFNDHHVVDSNRLGQCDRKKVRIFCRTNPRTTAARAMATEIKI